MLKSPTEADISLSPTWQLFFFHLPFKSCCYPWFVCHDKTLNQQCMLVQAHPLMINHLVFSELDIIISCWISVWQFYFDLWNNELSIHLMMCCLNTESLIASYTIQLFKGLNNGSTSYGHVECAKSASALIWWLMLKNPQALLCAPSFVKSIDFVFHTSPYCLSDLSVWRETGASVCQCYCSLDPCYFTPYLYCLVIMEDD